MPFRRIKQKFLFRLAFYSAFGLLTFGLWAGESVRMLVQNSPLAGSQFYALEKLLPQMQEGDALSLQREPDNKHDHNAVLVLWRGEKLGYLPRRENKSVAAAMDQGEKVHGRILRLRADPNPWKQLEIQIFLEL